MNKKKYNVGIKIQSETELETLLISLHQDLSDASIYSTLHTRIQNSINDYIQVFGESNTFWVFALRAMKTASMISLCKVFDQTSGNLSLHNFLCLIANNIEILSDEKFAKRNSANQFLENLLLGRKVPDINDVVIDIEAVSEKNPKVKTLILWRNTIIAHKGGNLILKSYRALDENPISNDDYLGLIELGYTTLNKYSDLLNGSRYSSSVIGDKDYISLLKNAKFGIEYFGNKIAAELSNELYKYSGSAYEI